MNIIPSVGPNSSLSSSWSQYSANAIAAVAGGSGNTGDPSIGPSAYTVAAGLNPDDLILSSFPSWEGIADPGGQFGGEYGAQLLFGLAIFGNGNYFRLSNLYNTMSSSDPGNTLAGNSGGFSVYGPNLVGIDCGQDGVCGTGDDIVYRNGEDASIPVSELFYVGVGAAFDATAEPGATNQDRLDNVAAFIFSNSPFSVSNTYTLYDDTGSQIITGAATLSEAPEPSTASLLMITSAVAGLHVLIRTSQQRPTMAISRG